MPKAEDIIYKNIFIKVFYIFLINETSSTKDICDKCFTEKDALSTPWQISLSHLSSKIVQITMALHLCEY